MFFKKIHLRQFRNFSDSQVEFSKRLNFIIGDNGQGKSNLLESLSLFSTGDSFRFADNENFIREKCNESFLKADIEKNDLDFEIKIQILKSRKQFLLNQKKVTSSELQKNFTAVIFSPESLSSIKDGSDQRRRLVDELVVSVEPEKALLMADFKKAHKTRNRILKNFAEKKVALTETKDLLESLNPSFLRLSTQLTMARLRSINQIQTDFNYAMQNISKNSSVETTVEYLISGEKMTVLDSEIILETMQKRLLELSSAELASGVSLVGPHKHEISFLYNQKDSRFYCSQGQQRAIILSFKMAQIVYHRKLHGEYPFLFLDDVLSELDSAKQEALISFLHEINTQTFITTTDLNLPSAFHLQNTSVIRVQDGKVIEKGSP